MMKSTLVVAGCLCMAAVPPASARTGDTAPILVDAGPSVEQWARNAGHELDRNLLRARADMPPDIPDAIVQIRFELVDGAPANLRLMRSSGKAWMDREAMDSVAAMNGLPALPRAYAGRTLQANIITARYSAGARRLQRELQRSEAARVASGPQEGAVLALYSGG